MPLEPRARAAQFLKWTDDVADQAEPLHQMFGDFGPPPITAVTYRDRPWPGWSLGFTYGASAYVQAGVEFVTVVRSRSFLWTWAVADFVDRHRDDMKSIGIEDTIDWHEPIAKHSEMDAFVIGPPVSLEPHLHVVHLADDDHIQLLQAIPVYASELPIVRRDGAKAFFREVGEDALNPRRPRLEDHSDDEPRAT
jgi:hypothetical protein